MKIKIYRIEDNNTTPRGFGRPPKFTLDRPRIKDPEHMTWVRELTCEMPEGFTTEQNRLEEKLFFDSADRGYFVESYGGKPVINVDYDKRVHIKVISEKSINM